MTAEQALDIFWEAYKNRSGQFSGRESLKQAELYKAGIEAVLSAYDKEWAERYLALEQSRKTINWQFKNGYLSPE